MEKAVLDAVYYSDTKFIETKKITVRYTCKKDFKTILGQAHKNVEIRKLLGNTDNISYRILHTISNMFDQLLVPMLNSLCIITREGNAIYISGPDNTQITTTGIIKIDAVLAELNINLYISQTPLVSKVVKTFYIFGMIGMAFWFRYNYQSDLNFFSFSKND